MPEPIEVLRAGLAGRYRIGDVIGSGGMATVYEAVEIRSGAPMAIKVLRPELAAVLGPGRFLREIAIADKLDHPAIVPLFDSGEAGGALYFVMPLIEGETLRDRIRRETQLTVDDAIAIACDVAAGLAYAHERGVVHRDIKPENILLENGRALIADFGVARVLDSVGDETLSTTGLALGTPRYMSPEQASGFKNVDRRSDIYSLGCVVYEMLAGEPPFTGPTPQAVTARHLVEAPPSLRVVRPGVPVLLQHAIEKALEKVPADRYGTATAFIDALRSPVPSPPRFRVATPALVVALVLVAATVAAAVHFWPEGKAAAGSEAIAVMPFLATGDSGAIWARRVRGALSRWEGIALVDQQAVERLAPDPAQVAPGPAMRELAGVLDAGYLVRGTVDRRSEGVRVSASIHDGRDGHSIAEHSVLVPAASMDSALGALAERLLFPGAAPTLPRTTPPSTRSVPARREWIRGHEAIAKWALADADTAFAKALRLDSTDPTAALWLAVVRLWQGAPGASLSWAIERTAPGIQRFTPRDRALAVAVRAVAGDEISTACDELRRALAGDSADFAVAQSLGVCLQRDDAVVRSRQSPSGWSFRASYAEALAAFRRAFALLPSIHRGMRDESFKDLRAALFVDPGRLRSGRSADGHQFYAHPEWRRDSLAFVPYPLERFTSLVDDPHVAGMQRALLRQRQLFYQIAAGWVAAYPDSPAALEALAIALDRLGDLTAADTLRRARGLAADPGEKALLAATEFWMRARLAVPVDLPELRRVAALGDSILAWPSPSGYPALAVATVALSLGRPNAAAQHLGDYSIRSSDAPPIAAREGLRLLSFAAGGGPPDSLSAIEARVETAIRQSVAPPGDTAARLQWLGRPATLAFPAVALSALEELAGQGDYLIDLIASYRHGDSAAARQAIAHVRQWRRGVSPGDLTVDALLVEAVVVEQVASPAEAAKWLDPTLNGLATSSTLAFLADLGSAGALPRAIGYRALLAARLADTASARRWAAAALALQDGAEPALRPRLDSLRRLGH